MTNDISIRPLELEDFNAFLDIQRDALVHAPEVFGSDYEWFEALSRLSKEQRYEMYLDFPYRFLLGVVHANGTILGMVGFSNEHGQTKTRHKGRLWGLYVRPEYRGHGFARTLLSGIIEAARDVVGCELLQLSVSTMNQASYQLYLRFGFTVYGTELRAMKVGDAYVDEYLMVNYLR
ncbi:MAG TPA: hypothetical protein DIS79_01240 [Bacteroidetes bacterium]|nr:hypothetical protein [Bacteroidota bacterium]HRK04854.1 GNAT family N-acetyltransferase [Chlorobiota bacterium]